MSTGYSINGKPVSLAEFRRGAKGVAPGAAPRVPSTANWPLCSDAAGVHPDQRQEVMAHSVKIGIPTEFNERGQAVFRSRKHRRDYCRAIGLHDANGGYSDP